MLEIRNLAVSYGQQFAIEDVTLSVPPSSIVALIGANGAGKTTTLRAIAGLTPSRSGQTVFRGKDITKFGPADIVMQGIAMSPEGRRVFADMTVHDNLLIGSYLNKDKADVARSLERMYNYFPRLRDRSKQYAGSLSGGEQQMLAIGRALMSRPKLLLLDEPSLGLAPLVVKEISRLLIAISREEDISVVLVEQNATMALRLASHAYVMEKGKIVLEGGGRELLASDYVRKAYLGI